MARKNGSHDEYAVKMIQYLIDNPKSSRSEVEAAIFTSPDAPTFHNIAHHVRNVFGEEVLVCRWSPEKGAYAYHLSIDGADGYHYVGKRRQKVRNESANLVGVCDRIIAKHGKDEDVSDIVLVRAVLESIVRILDAA